MNIERDDVVTDIHNAPGLFEIAVTGGGSSAIGRLLQVPGASNSLLNASVPYSEAALANYLGFPVKSACSELTARAMATKAFLNAKKLSSETVYGVGATAALQTNRQRRGTDRIHVAIQSQANLTTYLLELDPSQTRERQEYECASMIIHCIAQALRVDQTGQPQTTTPTYSQDAPQAWQNLLVGDESVTDLHRYKGIFPGAFNPPHDGHLAIREIAEKRLNGPVAFELSIYNVDKPPLDYIDMAQRSALLKPAPLVFSCAPTFSQKSEIFGNVCFVVGIDTLTRIDDKKYYGDSNEARDLALRAIADRDSRFLVFGREAQGKFVGLKDVELSPLLRSICEEVTEHEFRLDVSSTELRGDN